MRFMLTEPVGISFRPQPLLSRLSYDTKYSSKDFVEAPAMVAILAGKKEHSVRYANRIDVGGTCAR